MYAPAKRSLRGSVHRSLAPGSVVGSDPLRAGRDPDAGVDIFLNDAAAGIPDFLSRLSPNGIALKKTKKTAAAGSGEQFLTGKWRRDRDSNPGDGFPPTRVPGVRLRPLGHLSGRADLVGKPPAMQGSSAA